MKNFIIPNENVRLSGLPWHGHNNGKMDRLPIELKSQNKHKLWESVTEQSGVRYSFKSDATSMSIKVRYGTKEFVPRTSSIIGRAGIALRVNGDYWSFVFPFGKEEFEEPLFEDVDKEMREYTFFMPSYEVEILEIITDDDATIEKPSPYSIEKPVVFYGTSITQGNCASRCDLNYVSTIGRMLNVDYINLGFSSEGKGDVDIADAMTYVDASCYVIDFGQNNNDMEEFEKEYLQFVQAIRKGEKDTPIILTTPIFCVKESFSKVFKKRNAQKRDIIRKIHNEYIKSGDKNIYLIDGLELISHMESECISDHSHPNDLGYQKMATGIGKLLIDILEINI